jgi:hypothetical protein
MTSAEAISRIEAASHPGDLFGKNPSHTYRRLARLTHPDARPGDARAARAFAKLATLWHRHQGNHGPALLVARGDLANLYQTRQDLLKLPRDPRDNDLMEREAAALARLRAHGDRRYLPYVPRLLEVQRHLDSRSGARRHANVLDGYTASAAWPRSTAPSQAASIPGMWRGCGDDCWSPSARRTAWAWSMARCCPST